MGLGDFVTHFPQLFSFVRNENISVRKLFSQDAYSNFFIPLSMDAYSS